MRVIFIAVREHHYQYFNSLLKSANYNATLLRVKNILLPSFSGFKAIPKKDLKVISKLKVLEIVQSNYRCPPSIVKLSFLHIKSYCSAIIRYVLLYSLLKKESATHLAMWGGAMFNQSIARLAALNLGYKLIYFENGHLPNTTVIDLKGVNAENNVPRSPDFYKNLPDSYNSLGDLVPRKAKGKVGGVIELPELYIFAPFQVDVDRQILMHSPWIKNMRQLYLVLESALKYLPLKYNVVVKEHPSSEIRYPDLHLKNSRIIFANDNSTQELIKNSHAVITINSTVGIEALIFDKPVVTMGDCFYALNGIVKSINSNEQLKNLLHEIDDLRIDIKLKNQFLHYLKHDYLVDGDWKVADSHHIKAMNDRILGLMGS